MQVKRPKRIVLIHPGINAQLTRRIHGLGHALGISIEIYAEQNQLPPANDNLQSTLLFSESNEFDKKSAPCKGTTQVISSTQFSPAKLKEVHNDLWTSTPLSPESLYIAETLQLLTKSWDTESLQAQMGWQCLNFSLTSKSVTLTNKITETLKLLRLDAHAVGLALIAIATKMQKQAKGAESIQVEFTSDGNSLGVHWQFQSNIPNIQKILEILGQNYNSIHSCIVTKSKDKNAASLRSRYFLAGNNKNTTPFILVGILSDLEQSDQSSETEWEKSA